MAREVDMFGFISQKNIAVTANGIVEKPAEEIFGFIAPRFFENYAKWCPEVIEIECLSEAPVHQNSRGRQVTSDHGVETESDFEVSEFISNEKFAIAGIHEPFTSSYEITPLGPDMCRLAFSFEIKELDIVMRPFQKLIKIALQEGAARTVENIKQLLEHPQPA